MPFVSLCVNCNVCGHQNTIQVENIPGYEKTIQRSFNCSNWECEKIQVVRYKFEDGVPEVLLHLDPSVIFAQRELPTGITIRPKGKTSHV